MEVQLRTETQHREAQFGIASHLTYKENQHASDSTRTISSGGGLEWLRQFLPGWKRSAEHTLATSDDVAKRPTPRWIKDIAHMQDEMGCSQEYIDTLKADFFSHRVFVFTPNGDVIDLPIAATPIDFAYAVHSDVGNTMAGARVNNKMVSLDTALKNGDIVEIITKPSAHPSRKWHDIAKTSMARKHIRTALAAREKKQ